MILEVAPNHLNKKQYASLIRMNLGDKGIMKDCLRNAFSDDPHRLGYTRNEKIFIYQQDNQIISWALLANERNCKRCRWKTIVHIYTRPKFRNKGYAGDIMKYITELYWPRVNIDKSKPPKLYCRGNVNFYKRYRIKYG